MEILRLCCEFIAEDDNYASFTYTSENQFLSSNPIASLIKAEDAASSYNKRRLTTRLISISYQGCDVRRNSLLREVDPLR